MREARKEEQALVENDTEIRYFNLIIHGVMDESKMNDEAFFVSLLEVNFNQVFVQNLVNH